MEPRMFGSSSFPNPDTDFSPSPQTQGLQVPGRYRPYPVDEQDATEGQYEWAPETGTGWSASTPPLSQIPEGGSNHPDAPFPRSVRVRTRGRTGDPNIRTPYTPGEMEKLFKAYSKISEDAEVGTNQTRYMFWSRAALRYNATRPKGTIERNESMVRNAIGRANEEIQKFQGYYLQEQRSAGSDTSEVDVITTAMSTYHSVHYKPFKLLNACHEVRHHPNYKGGVGSSSNSSSKRLRSVSPSNTGEDEVASQLVGAHFDSHDVAPSSSQHRPPRRKQATVNRRRATTPATPRPPAPAPFVSPPSPTSTLWPFLVKA